MTRDSSGPIIMVSSYYNVITKYRNNEITKRL